MKKIAILACLKSNKVCTGASCFYAFNEKKDAFSMYNNEAIQLVAFVRCNGCSINCAEDKGMQEKLERLVKEGVDTVHLGLCTLLGKVKEPKGSIKCKDIIESINYLESKGIKIVQGTHC